MVGRRAAGLGRITVLFIAVGACALGVWAELTVSPGYRMARGEAHLRAGEAAAALLEVRRAAALDPGSVQAQQALVHASIVAAGAPTRETLAALTAAYAASPYGPAATMVWRVDLADAYWSSMPDPLASAALSQIDALGRMGDDWRPRVRWCRSAVTEAIAEAACRTVPGVEKGADRPS